MSVSLHWFLPTAGDSRDIVPTTTNGHHRPATVDYLSQVALAADQLGYTGVLTPTGTWCEDAWIISSTLLAHTRALHFIVAFRPGTISPTLAAQMASTFQRASCGRLRLNIVTGGEDDEQRRFGDQLNKDERYRRTDEFLTILRGAWQSEPFDYTGSHYDVTGATCQTPPNPTPPIYFGGASPAAEQVAARHADVYLLWGEPPAMIQERLERMRALAANANRELRFGIRLHVITRDHEDQAWAETDRLLATMDPATIAATQRALQASNSVGQQRMAQLHGGRTDDLVIAPNLWAGVGLVRGGAGTALVGDHAQIAQRISDYHNLGITEFILSGHPHLEEAFTFAEGVSPILRNINLLPPHEHATRGPQTSPAYIAQPTPSTRGATRSDSHSTVG